ncbi:MAG TPA: hypothetical protein VE268_08305 [Herpetosiphonaceae bacterium]|jgi:hypothetical protein|nr:hypothetical protein [Herpetosiphonaceae bacterium]
MVASGGLLYLLLAASLARRVPALPPDGLTWTLPIPHGSALEFTLWSYDLEFSPAYTTGGLTRQRPGPLRLTVEYEPGPLSVTQLLAVVPVPTWPMGLMATLLMLAGVRLWPQRPAWTGSHSPDER